MPLIEPSPCRHAHLQRISRPVLSLRVRSIEPAVAVVGRPVILIMAIDVAHRVLCLVSGWVDKRKRLARHASLPTERPVNLTAWSRRYYCYSIRVKYNSSSFESLL